MGAVGFFYSALEVVGNLVGDQQQVKNLEEFLLYSDDQRVTPIQVGHTKHGAHGHQYGIPWILLISFVPT